MSRGYSNPALHKETHPGARAGTMREERGISAPIATKPITYCRGAGQAPFTAIHNPNVHRPYGLWVVYVGRHRIGQQLSQPTIDDCSRMWRERG